MRYFLMDKDWLSRIILKDIIEKENLGELVGEAADGFEVQIDILRDKRVDVVLLDLAMPLVTEMETLSKLRKSLFNATVVVTSNICNQNVRAEVFAQGAEYCIEKPIYKKEMIAILKKVERNKKAKEMLLQLTEDELKVLELVYRGNKLEKISEVQFMPVSTLKSLTVRIRKKLDVKTTKDAADKAKSVAII